jgi:transcriptional regulator with XRE-family HTH domain
VLKQWLQAKGETYESFSRKIGVSVPLLCNILSGKQANIKVDLLQRIVQATRLDAGELMDDLVQRFNDYHMQQAQLEEDKGKDIL